MRRGQQRLDAVSPQLPTFTATRTGGKKFNVLLTCGHCGNALPVNWKKLLGESEYKTRPCAYCFKTNKLPTRGKLDA